MRIAICDHQGERMEWMKTGVSGFLAGRGISAEILCYAASEAFSAAMDEMRFDLVFLELDGHDYSGFALARKLRGADVRCEIVFTTSYLDFMPEAFAYRPIGYIHRPVSVQELQTIMERFLFYCGHRSLYYTMHTREKDYHIPHDRIRYFQSDGHRVLIHMDAQDTPLVHLRRLDDIERQLVALPYLRCHQSYLVSCRAVRQFEHRHPRLILDDGTEIPVSKRYFNEVTAQLLERNQI